MEPVDISKYRKKKTESLVEEPLSTHKETLLSLSELLSKDISFNGGRFSDKKKQALFSELSTLLHSGIDLKNSLDLITIEKSKDKSIDIIKTIKDNVIIGKSLSTAVQMSAKFSDYDFYSIQIGEETGNQAVVLEELSVFYSRKVEQRRKILSALTYPAIVLSTSAGAVFFMLRFVVPMFSDVFKRFGGKLPWMTEIVITTSAFLGNYLMTFLLILSALSLFIYKSRSKMWFRRNVSKMVLSLPVLGELVKKIYLARFCNTMRLLVSTKIPLLRAIKMCERTIGFYPIELSLNETAKGIMNGRTLHDCLSDYSIYPQKIVQLIKVGEEINKLDYFFENISAQYVAEIEFQTAALSKLIEPLIIIFLGFVVGFILVAMYLPMFEMSNSF